MFAPLRSTGSGTRERLPEPCPSWRRRGRRGGHDPAPRSGRSQCRCRRLAPVAPALSGNWALSLGASQRRFRAVASTYPRSTTVAFSPPSWRRVTSYRSRSKVATRSASSPTGRQAATVRPQRVLKSIPRADDGTRARRPHLGKNVRLLLPSSRECHKTTSLPASGSLAPSAVLVVPTAARLPLGRPSTSAYDKR